MLASLVRYDPSSLPAAHTRSPRTLSVFPHALWDGRIADLGTRQFGTARHNSPGPTRTISAFYSYRLESFVRLSLLGWQDLSPCSRKRLAKGPAKWVWLRSWGLAIAACRSVPNSAQGLGILVCIVHATSSLVTPPPCVRISSGSGDWTLMSSLEK